MLNATTIRIDSSGADWAEVEVNGKVIRRCHADSELIDTLLDLLVQNGATVEVTRVTGPRVNSPIVPPVNDGTKATVVAWGGGIKIDFGGSQLNVHTHPGNQIDSERARALSTMFTNAAKYLEGQ